MSMTAIIIITVLSVVIILTIVKCIYEKCYKSEQPPAEGPSEPIANPVHG